MPKIVAAVTVAQPLTAVDDDDGQQRRERLVRRARCLQVEVASQGETVEETLARACFNF
jgi:hypothetical protein